MGWLRMRITYDSTYNEPKPKRYFAIHCFTCKKNLPGKSHCHNHLGHDVHYVKPDGSLDEN